MMGAIRPSAGSIVFLGAHVCAVFVDVDRVPQEGETVLGIGAREPIDGGKSTCQAVAAARLGAPVTFVSVLGSDERGRWWCSFLADEGVDTQWVLRADGLTDVGIVLLPPSRIPGIVSVTELSRLLNSERVRAVTPAIETASMVVCALESSVETVETAFSIARKAGVLTVLNPSPVQGVSDELLGLADIIVANEIEAEQLVGRTGDPRSFAQELAARVRVAAVVTAGAQGAWLGQPSGEAIHAPAPSVVPVDTTGAGDAFLGALAARLHAGAPLVDAVRFGVGVASRSVLTSGSIASYPGRADVEP